MYQVMWSLTFSSAAAEAFGDETGGQTGMTDDIHFQIAFRDGH